MIEPLQDSARGPGPSDRGCSASVMSDRIECARCRIAWLEGQATECLIDMENDGVRHEQIY